MAVEQNYTMQEAHQTCRVIRVTTGERLPDDQHYFNWPCIGPALSFFSYYRVHDYYALSHPFSSVISPLLTRAVCTSVCHVAMEEVSFKEDPSDLTLVHPALDPTSALRKWQCTQLSRIKRKSYCMQSASFPTHPNKELKQYILKNKCTTHAQPCTSLPWYF